MRCLVRRHVLRRTACVAPRRSPCRARPRAARLGHLRKLERHRRDVGAPARDLAVGRRLRLVAEEEVDVGEGRRRAGKEDGVKMGLERESRSGSA